jgi:hypothetical protein
MASVPTRFSGRVASFTTIFKAEILVDRHHQVVDLQDFRLELVFGAEHMRIVLREAAHPHQPVQRARRLVAVHVAELGQPDRQLAIGFQPVLEDLHMARGSSSASARRRG